jgi:DNA-directed RNA polymerase subunit RPC12/RpoP
MDNTNWLTEREIPWTYRCNLCRRELVIAQVIKPTSVEEYTCERCGKSPDWEYVGFKPDSVSIGTRVSFEQNGRIAYKFDSGTGKPSYMSKTKYDYIEKGSQESKTTRSYDEAVKEKTKQVLNPNASVTKVTKNSNLGE